MRATFVGPEKFENNISWRPQDILEGQCSLSSAIEQQIELGKLGTCLEGWRVSLNRNSPSYDSRIEQSPLYRQQNVEFGYLNLTVKHWEKPPLKKEIWSVQPGDILIPKIAPLKAALINEGHPRHPADGNLLILRRVESGMAVWVLLCLNMGDYTRRLTSSSSTGKLLRVGKKAINALKLPSPKPSSCLR